MPRNKDLPTTVDLVNDFWLLRHCTRNIRTNAQKTLTEDKYQSKINPISRVCPYETIPAETISARMSQCT